MSQTTPTHQLLPNEHNPVILQKVTGTTTGVTPPISSAKQIITVTLRTEKG